MVGEDSKSVMINSNLVPSFLNDNHVLSRLQSFERYFNTFLRINFYSPLEESTIKDILGPETYQQIKTVLNKDQISKLILSKKNDSKVQLSKKKLKRPKKRTKKESLLHCREKIIVDSPLNSPSKFTGLKVSKRDLKTMRKRLESPGVEVPNSESGSVILGIPEAKNEFHKEKLLKFETPLREDIGRFSILDQMFHKNCFDSLD